MMLGLFETAAVWVGLALLMIALVYPLASATAFIVMMVGTWLAAAGVVAAGGAGAAPGAGCPAPSSVVPGGPAS